MTDEGKPLRVLVVDDVIDMADMIADELEARGYRATAVSSGRDALRPLSTERVDAIVTDLRMPDVDGLSLLRASKALEPARPVFLMTAFEAIDTAREAIEQGVAHCLAKPFRLETLVRLLDHAMAHR